MSRKARVVHLQGTAIFQPGGPGNEQISAFLSPLRAKRFAARAGPKRESGE